MAKKLYKKTGNNTYEIQGILPTETEWGKVVLTDTNQTITGTKTFDVAYANVFATGEGEGNYFQCRKFRGEGNASTYYHALEFGYAGHNQWDFYEYGGIYNFYQNTTSDGSGKVNLFQISPDGVTSHKPLIAESTLTAKGAFTSSASTTLSHIKNAGILGTDSSGKVCDNSSKYQKAGDYATKSDLTKYQPAGSYQPKGDYVTYDNASKDIYLGSNGIYSGTRPSSGSATLMGNGYWIKPSYVGVSSAVVGGTVHSVSSEMTPDYVSISNGKIKLNTSGIVSDAGTFKFDGNPGSVATSADINNLQTALNGKANSSHTHSISQITNLQTSLDGKASKSHTHTISQITNLQKSLDAKLDKTTYEWNKEFAAGSNGAISLGRYNIYDSQLTFDITSTTNQSISGKLVIATQNGTIHQAKVFGDASGALVSKLIIYQSAISNSRSWVEVFCNFNGWSKNKVHIYAVALNSATVQKQMTSVTISNGVPAAANVTSGDTKWTGTIVNDFSHSHSNYVTTNTKQSITGQKTFDATPVLSKIKGAKVVGTNANGLIEAHTLAKSDVGLGNVDNTADKDKNVKHASSSEDATNAFKLVSEDKTTEYDYTDIFSIYGRVSALERYTKVYYVDTNITTSNNHGTPINSKFESNAEMISSDMSTNFDTHPTNQCIYADSVGDVTPNELKIGDIIVIDGYLLRYVSDKTTVSTNSSGQASVIRVKFTAINKQYLDRINGKANVGHTHAISEITNLQSTLNGKANASHTHTISQITNLQTTLDNKQNKIENPCGFTGSNGNYVKLIRAGTKNYYVEIEHGSVTYNGSTTQYPEINVTFPHNFNVESVNDKPTVIVSFAPTSNSTGTYEALKVINVTSTGFTVITRMSASISGGYFRVNWIAIYTV